MRISKILNNNAAICLEGREEVIVRGKGVSFQKTVGDRVDPDLVEKIYRLDSNVKSNFEELISTIDDRYLDIADDIIKYTASHLSNKLSDVIYISLANHIALSVERCMKSLYVPNPFLLDIKRFYPDEYEIGLYAVELIEEKTGVVLTEDEAGFIAIHIVNAESFEEIHTTYEAIELIQTIMNILRLRFNIEYNKKSIIYYRFLTHLKYFVERILTDKQERNECGNDIELEIVKKEYVDAYKCTEYIADFIQNKYAFRVSGDEKLYLTIYIQKILNETKKDKDN